jgi:hypothetical protein
MRQVSNNATGWQTVPPNIAWPKEQRLKMMREVIGLLARHGETLGVSPKDFARTYGVTEADVDAELLRHLSEGEGK